MRFYPAEVGGRKVKQLVQQPFTFSLTKELTHHSGDSKIMDLSLAGMWAIMGPFAKGIVIVLALMSVYSLTIMVSKWWNLRKAQKETRKFAPEFSQFLEEDNLTEAIKLAESYKKSHVALVLGGALGEVSRSSRTGRSRSPTSTRRSARSSATCSSRSRS